MTMNTTKIMVPTLQTSPAVKKLRKMTLPKAITVSRYFFYVNLCIIKALTVSKMCLYLAEFELKSFRGTASKLSRGIFTGQLLRVLRWKSAWYVLIYL